MKTKLELEQGAQSILQKLIQHGFQAYLVGGCVRDKQLRRAVKDYDIATSALPEQVLELFERTIPTGLQHGTVSVIVNTALYEVTTFRKEADYEQFRRPVEVQFIDSLHEDLKRRDFTMNAMALDVQGELIDPFGGMADLEQGILRCVGNAEERFNEDALRMLRCIRFSSEYKLQVEGSTWLALCKQVSLLKHIAMERVRMELERMVAGANPLHALKLLVSSGILHEVKVPLKLAQIEQKRQPVAIGLLAEPVERWSYLYLTIGLNAAEAQADMRKLTFSKVQMRIVCNSIAAAYKIAADSSGLGILDVPQREELSLEVKLGRIWKLALLRYGKEGVQTIGSLLAVDPAVLEPLGITAKVSSVFIQHREAWLNGLVIDRLEQLQVGGKDLLGHIKLAPGPWLADVLQHLLQETALGRVPNEPEALLAEAFKFIEAL
jgi:tRNA nucleotidyltransferase (CCA-adding enzyme)